MPGRRMGSQDVFSYMDHDDCITQRRLSGEEHVMYAWLYAIWAMDNSRTCLNMFGPHTINSRQGEIARMESTAGSVPRAG